MASTRTTAHLVTLTGNAEYNIIPNVWAATTSLHAEQRHDDPLDIENNLVDQGPANMSSKSVLIQNNHNIHITQPDPGQHSQRGRHRKRLHQHSELEARAVETRVVRRAAGSDPRPHHSTKGAGQGLFR